jgi:hypothetical protein
MNVTLWIPLRTGWPDDAGPRSHETHVEIVVDLPGVPRIGDLVGIDDDEFDCLEVVAVTWRVGSVLVEIAMIHAMGEPAQFVAERLKDAVSC